MRTKFFFIYLLAGVAFLAVSLWVFLSNGRSAKAVRAKYKMGGILLTASAMMSVGACKGVTPPVVTCYEPVVTCYDAAMPNNYVVVEAKADGSHMIKSGEILRVAVQNPTVNRFVCRIYTDVKDASPVLIQEQVLETADENTEWELTLAQTDYKGQAQVRVFGLFPENDGSETEREVGSEIIQIR